MQKMIILLVMPLVGLLYSADNQLTSAERKEGWSLLFDGKSMNGWRTYKNLPENSWEVVDGQLHSKTESNGAT